MGSDLLTGFDDLRGSLVRVLLKVLDEQTAQLRDFFLEIRRSGP